MLNSNSSQISFNGGHPVHQLNKLSKKLTDGKMMTRVVDDKFCKVPAKIGGELAEFKKLDNGRWNVDLPILTELKDGPFLESLSSTGRGKAGAAKNLLKRIKDGVIVVTDAYNPERAEYFVQQGQHGIKIEKLNTLA